MEKRFWILVVICVVFLATRLFNISEIPASLYWDEASIGYNAFSISEFGKDEWGDSWPIHFRAFGEFKLPVYIYSVVFLDKLFGVSDINVRLPSVFFSLITVLLTYQIVKLITKQHLISLLAALFMTVSPWLFIFSRTGFEATGGLMFYLLGIYLWLISSRRRYVFVLMAVCFLLSMYSYNSFRVLVPITLVLMVIQSLSRLKMKYISSFIISWLLITVILVLGSIPIIRLTILDNGANRLQTVGVFSRSETKNEKWNLLLNNYLSHFSPHFLFISGDSNPRLNMPGSGQLYWVSLPLILLGLWKAVKEKNNWLWPVFLSLIAPMPAAITIESPHALRSLAMAPALIILMAFGVLVIVEQFNQHFRKICLTTAMVFILFFGFYLFRFYSSYNQQSSADWQYAYREVFTKYSSLFNEYDRIVVSDSLAQPYIFALYYQKYDLESYLNSVQYNSVDKFGFSKVAQFDKLSFMPIKNENLPSGKLLIFTSVTEGFKEGSNIGKITDLNNQDSIKIWHYQK